ncbi:MAG: LysM peptidoglycan-binding domain-containing protein [Pseudomonadota bacterium]|nr:LysM peptidoglycan-binding domain-containing protein [Pseudomonadota bacterium]
MLTLILFITIFVSGHADNALQALPTKNHQRPTSIWDVLRDHFSLEAYEHDPLVAKHITWFQKHPHDLRVMFQRAGWYLHFTLATVIDEKLPGELALLPAIESHFNPFAHSAVGASGLWQIMPSVASGYQLTVDKLHDDRRDIVLSTYTAVRHLRYLHNRLHNNWIYAISAYNAGEGNVSRSLKKHFRSHKTAPKLAQLSQIPETQHYVPKLLALRAIINNPKKYGIKLPNIANRAVFGKIQLTTNHAFSEIAQVCDIHEISLRMLNPSWRRQTMVASSPNYDLYLPLSHIQTCSAKLRKGHAIPQNPWHHHVVTAKDSLASLAKQYQTTQENIRNYNHLSSTDIHPKQILLILPNQSKTMPAHHNPKIAYWIHADQLPGPKKIVHLVKSGQSLKSIAKRYFTTPAKIRYWNHILEKDSLIGGEELVIWQPNRKMRFYTVIPGDTLGSIAKRMRISLKKLKSLNNLTSNVIHPAKKLRIR